MTVSNGKLAVGCRFRMTLYFMFIAGRKVHIFGVRHDTTGT